MSIRYYVTALLFFISSLCFATEQIKAPKQAQPAAQTSESESYCDEGGTLEQVQCLAKITKKLDAEMNAVYQKALTAMPEKSETDTRKEREQLRKSQRAWLKYKDENCNLIGGMEGGSNLWVTYFSVQCENEAITNRIKFLKGIVDNSKD